MNMNNYYTARKNIFQGIRESSTVAKILMSFLMACFTGLMAQIIIPLPWTPVPITAQTFAVLCSGLILGKRYGCLSQILYVALGATCVPWFASMSGGIDVLLGSNCGYFIGFILASYFADARNFTKMAAVIGVANFAIIYIPGLAGLALWAYMSQGAMLSISELLIMGFIPFIVGDIVKILGAASVSKVFLPKE